MKQVLDIAQMQLLQELGLEIKDPMLYWIVFKVGNEKNFVTTKEYAMEIVDESCVMLPAYTLQDMLELLPRIIKVETTEYFLSIYPIEGEWAVDYCSETGADIQSKTCENIIDSAYSRLLWCIEQGFVKTNKDESLSKGLGK